MGDGLKHFSMVDPQGTARQLKIPKNRIDHLDILQFEQQAIRANGVGIALGEFLKTTVLRTIGTPNGLHLIAFEWKAQFVLMLHHKAGKRHGEVIAHGFVGQGISKTRQFAVF